MIEWIWIIILIILHEIGHMLIAREQGVYKGWGILPTPHIKMDKPYKSRWDYLSGIGLSLLSFPIFIFTGLSYWIFFAFVFGAGVIDLFIVMFYSNVTKRKEGK